jgi:glycine/D-amino acid oxidase-like deaminating enzyme
VKIAIVGAGLAGLSVAFHLSQKSIAATLFDPKGIGGGSSGISTGLLHPFSGRRALLSWNGAEGMEATKELIAVSAKFLGRPVGEASGIFRPALTPQQRTDFIKRGEEREGAVWQEREDFGPGLWIPGGVTLYSRLYLQGLWMACQEKGATLVEERVHSLDDLEAFDRIVLTTGFESLKFAPHLPLSITKGQTLLCRWKKRLPFSLVSMGHITPTEDADLCQVGSTYEHDYSSLDPDPACIGELIEKVAKFYPPARKFEVVEVRAGARISQPKGYRPIVEKIGPKTWVFTGLGSRGLLYHALLGKKLVDDFLLNSLPIPTKIESG